MSASESGHWYGKDGSPQYTMTGANGAQRNTTLRDARKIGLVPSVTTILSVADKPALTAWKVDQALMAALTLPRIEGESLDDFKKRAALDAKQQSIDAADEGTRIHAAIESWFSGQAFHPMYERHVVAAVDAINATFPHNNWLPEKSFCSPLGYGGKVDLHSERVVIDIKTKEFGSGDKVVAYDDQIMQLDAYRHGLRYPEATMANVYVSRSCPGEVRVIVHDNGNHFERFMHLLEYWKLSKNYNPMEVAA
jgi:hypothetical protein